MPLAAVHIEKLRGLLLVWKMKDEVLAVRRFQALDGNEQLLNGLSLRQSSMHKKNTRHRLANPNSLVCETRHRFFVVREEDSLLGWRPSPNGRIGSAHQAHVLHAR